MSMSPSPAKRYVTVCGMLVFLVLAFALMVAATWQLLGAGAGRALLANGGCGVLLALGEIGYGVAAHRWLTPLTAARLSLVAMPLLVLVCFVWVRALQPVPAVPYAVLVVWGLYATWAMRRTWQQIARPG